MSLDTNGSWPIETESPRMITLGLTVLKGSGPPDLHTASPPPLLPGGDTRPWLPTHDEVTR